MNAFPPFVQSSRGQTFHLSKQIGKGGEGAVYETREQSDIALKLYWPTKAQSRRAKIAAMASAQWAQTNSFVAFPMDALFAPNGTFVGFVMKKIGGCKPVHMLYSPASRKVEFSQANYRFLVRAAGNLARAVASVHACGCVIGDINHSGFLVSNKATSIVIDSDSFQVVAANNKFLCQVGTPEYTPPELQGARFDRVVRTPNHDNFGLAVLLFQILFMGRHPFSGRYQGAGDMPLERAIFEHRFAYSSQISMTRMEPPPGAPLLTDFPVDIGQTFENGFGRSGQNKRSSAIEWISLLDNLEKTLVTCSVDSSHQHVQGKPCPWCRMEQSSPGFIAFNSNNIAAALPIHIDVSQCAAIIRSIRDPGPIPDIQTAIIVQTSASPAAPTAALLVTLRTRALIGIGASAGGAMLIFFGGLAILPGLAALGVGLVANVVIPKELKGLRQARSQANTTYRSIQDAWTKQPGNKQFLQTKTELDELIRSLTDLPNEERREIRLLEQKKREAQLRRYLDRFLIANAKIKKIGSGRKAVLASFGVQTAADVDRQRIAGIQGFGPALIAELMTWRQNVANKFVFNASEPVSQNDLSALKARIANRKAELDKRIRASTAILQQASTSSLSHRAKLTNLANHAFAARRQAEINEKAATGPLHKASKFISICCAGLAAIGLMIGESFVRPSPPQDRLAVATSVPEVPIARPQGPPAVNKYVPPKIQSESRTDATPPLDLSRPNPTPPNDFTPPQAPIVPALPPAQEIPQVPVVTLEASTNGVVQRQLSDKAAVTQVQQRLIALSYLSAAANGIWGPQSKRALVEFKQQVGLEKSDSWNVETEHALFSDDAPYATRTLLFIGGWTPDQGQCGEVGELPPLRITADRAETDGGVCEFKSVRPDGDQSWRIEANCSAAGSSHVAHVRLAVKGQILQWTSEQPQTLYYRCESPR
ncbi:MAG TPA: peptidoglycan-binding protein [Bryobacteraceae bacterium]|jgi:DNA-binding helix-hairpin-helix protein with protein kinase domain|nr:peptidoglycan-binding protein [Bryobacteraceae bacterium]